MATKTEELIHALEKDVATLKERVDALRGETESIRDMTNQIAILEHKLAELAKVKELWGQRGWMILTIALSALFSFLAVFLGALLTHFLNSLRGGEITDDRRVAPFACQSGRWQHRRYDGGGRIQDLVSLCGRG